MKPKIMLVITDYESNSQIRRLGVDGLELRVDLFKKTDIVYVVHQIKQRRFLKIPLLLTVRNLKKEGARKCMPDQRKMALIDACLPLVDMVDIELSSPLLNRVVAQAHGLNKKVIVSAHFFDAMPKNLVSILRKAQRAKADIVKIAAVANSWQDVFDMIAFTQQHRKYPLITMSLGPMGAISRVLLPAAGSMATYTFVHKPTAPGQMDVVTLKANLKFYYP